MTRLARQWLPRHLLIWLFAIVAGVLWYQPAYAADFTVDDTNCSIPSGNYCTIQLAVAAASNGDTIKVFPGIYNGVVDVNKDLTIETTGSGTWLLTGAFNLQVSNITIDGFTIIGAIVPSYGTQPLGINVVGATDGHLIQNNVIAGAGAVAGAIGIQVGYDADNISFIDNEIANWGTGIYLNPSTGHTIEGNTFSGSIAGIGSDGISNVDIRFNDFSDNTEGLGASTVGADVQVHSNDFAGNGDAINHYGGSVIDARGNWYGDASGPATVGPGTGDNVSANITFCPWLNDIQGTGQFTNSPGLGTATSPNDPIPFCSIQKAVDASSSGQTVSVTAGVFNENVVVNKPLTLDGAGAGTNSSLHTIIDGNSPTPLNNSGIEIAATITGVTIQDLRVQDFIGTNGNGIRGVSTNNNLIIQDVQVDNNGVAGSASGGIFLTGPINGVTIDQVSATNNKTRGIVIWDGFKQNITITNNYVAGNNCCGIELQDGTASGVTVTGNTIENNTDSGMAFTGLTDGAGPNVISNNTVRNNGRFGIEIKLPEGSGLESGDGSIVVSNNTVTRTMVAGAELRDLAGIAVFRRAWVPSYGNVDIPTGVVVKNNSVSGFQQTSDSEGFCIVVEGNNMQVLSNTVTSCDVGIQMQAGHTPYTANTNIDGDQTNLVDLYFGRGNSPAASGVIYYNNVAGNLTAGIRKIGGTDSVDARANWWGSNTGPGSVGPGSGALVSTNVTFCPWLDNVPGTGEVTNSATFGLAYSPNDPLPYCSIQKAVDISSNGQTVTTTAGIFNENVVIDKPLTLDGAGAGTNSALHTIIEGNAPANLNGIGIQLVANVTGITIQDLSVQNFDGTSGSGIRGSVGNSNLLIQNVHVDNNGVTGTDGGIYLDGPVSNVTIDNVRATNNRTRGIVIWNGFKQNITITNNYVAGNNCCGIELQDGTASGVTVTGNTIENNTDSGMAFTGLKGPDANLISNNTVRNNGRFGIEVKMPDGNGLESGGGSIVVSNNTVTRTTVAGAELRDLAGIAIFRRGLVDGNGNVDIPTGVVVKNNSVSGFQQTSDSEGFCIVVEGNNMQVLSNTVTSCDVGIQMQAGHTPYTANTNIDGDQTNLVDLYFGRGNSPAASGVIYYNNVAGNLTAGIRKIGGTDSVDARANWWGSNTGPGSVGPGSGALVSTNVTFCPWLDNVAGVGEAISAGGFVTTTGDPIPYCTIQGAIDASANGDTVSVYPGDYSEFALDRPSYPSNGPAIYDFGLYIVQNNLTVQGVDANGTPITDPTLAQANVKTNATNNFGYSGIFVVGDEVTLSGLEIQENLPENNKTIEILGNAFTLKNSHINVPPDGNDTGGAIYFGDWQYNGVGNAHIEAFTIDNNIFAYGSQVGMSSGTGATGSPANRLITNNTFQLVGRSGPAISFNGAGGVPWYVYPVGAATITGNDFSGGGMYIRARGDYDNAGMNWTNVWNNNDFDRAVVALVGPYASPFDVRAYSYQSGSYTFTNVRMIGGTIQPHISQIAQTGDTVYVDEGTYVEKVTLKSGVDLLGINESSVVISGSVVITGALANVTAQDFSVHNGNATSYLLDMRYAGALTDIVFDGVTFELVGDFIPVNGPGTYSNDAPIGNSYARPSFELIDGGDSDNAGLTFTDVVMDSGDFEIGPANELALLFFKSNSGAKLLLDNLTLRGLSAGTANLGAQFNTSPGMNETAHIEVRNSATQGGGNFYLSGFASAIVENNVFDAQGFALNGVKNATVAGNTFQNINNTLTANGTQHRGLTIEDAWGTTGVSNLEIHDNIFNNIAAPDGAVAFQRFTSPPSDLATLARLQDAVVRDNTFTAVNTPVYLNATYFGAGASLPMELMTVPEESDQFALGTPGIDTITFVGDRDQYTVTLRAFPGYIHSAMQISDTAQTTTTLLFAYEILEWDDQTVLFVAPSGSGAPFNTIQDAVNAAPPGAVIEVYPGTYTENVNINKSVTLRSVGGRDQTTIVGISGVGALGTVQVTNNTNGLVIDGFTIEGIDNNDPGIENAALYFQGPHSNAKIINNEINANGDLALVTEYGATISGFLLDNNIFGGQTFTGTPAGQGSSQQFTLPNVPRQLVVISGGAGGGNTSVITFTNNLIQGVTGGINGSSQEQGNTLVTIDANGATITGNTFAGFTTYFGYSLRTRGPNTVIENNDFSSAGMGTSTGHIFTQNHPVPLTTVIANNEFDKGSYVANANGPIFTGIGVGIASATAGETVIALPGLYVENVAYNNAVSLQGAGSGAANLCGIGDPDTQTIIRATSGNLIQLAASGPSSANKLVIKDIRLELQSTVGTQYGIGVATNVDNIKLERVRIIGNAAATLITQRGLVVSSATSIANWEITDSSFNCLFVGLWLAKETTAAASAQADNIIVTGSDFRENGIKGMYVEKLSNATISNNEFIDNNKALDKVSTGAAHSAGLDINLKFGAYSNISVVGNTFTGNGTGAGEGAALLIKARDDAPSYNSIPASLISVTVASNVITGNERGIRLGEPLKANNGPTQVDINHNLILTNTKAITTNGSTYGGFIDWTTSPTVAVNRNALFNNSAWNIAETNGGTVNGTCNWYGTSAGPGSTVTNTVTATPWLITSNLDGNCVSGSVTITMAVVGSSSFAPPTWAYTSTLGNFTLPQAGGTQTFNNLTAATYVVTQTVDPDYTVAVNCGDGVQSSNVATIGLDMAENASCVFTNTLKPATLTITKTVINNHGGVATVSSFSLFVSGSPVTSGQANLYVPGTYFVTESDVPNYSSLISGDCAANGSITLAPGGTYGCTITNDDLVQGSVNLSKIVVGGSSFAPSGGWQFYLDSTPFTVPANGGSKLLTDLAPGTYTISEVVDSNYATTLNCGAGTVQGSSAQISVGLGEVVSCIFTNTVKTATLTVNKVVVNDNGGTAVAGDFPLFVDSVPVTNGVAISVTPGLHIVTENAGTYTSSFSGDCSSNGTMSLQPGESKTCTLTNNDPGQGTLNLTKVVVGDSSFAPSGGWQFYLGSTPILLPAAGGNTQLTNVVVGSYTISEVVDSDYTTSFNCGAGTAEGSSTPITFALGQTINCVFTNTVKSATLTVNKVVVNDNGGTAVAGDFPLFIDSNPVVNGVANTVTPGIHIVTENAGTYAGSFSGDCSANGTVNLVPGDNKTCTLTNDDPGQGVLNLTKVVVGSSSFAPSGGWQFQFGNTPITLPAAGGSTQLTDVAVGSYTISEAVDSEYTTSFSCGNATTVGSSTTITFTLGQTINCVFTNTVKSSTLTVNKIVVNDNGGTAVVSDFPLFVNGNSVTSGISNTLTPDTYVVTEDAGEYIGSFSGDCSANGTVTLVPGDAKTCTLTNNDPGAGTLNLTKVVVGSSAFAPAAGWSFTLDATDITLPAAGGNQLVSDIQPGSYTLTEEAVEGYSTVINCGNGITEDNSTEITFALGQTVSCVVTNTVDNATLTVTKVVVNDNGGSAVVADFDLFVNGTSVTSGEANAFTPGTYTVSEDNFGGYNATFSGDCASNGTVSLAPGDVKSCTITNNDPSQGTVSLTKLVVGSSAFAPIGGWQFTLGDTEITIPAAGGTELITNVEPGTYTLSEVADADYTTTINCGNGATAGTSVEVTVALGEPANCTFTNTLRDASLTVTKVVINDNGGTAVVADFPLLVNNSSVTSGASNTFAPGTYTVSESNQGNYARTFSGDCSAAGVVTLAPGDVKSCTITNNDIAVGEKVAEISLVKTVGVIEGVCATATAITVLPGETVYYCYTVTNTGNVTLTEHTLVDNRLGTLIDGLATSLTPGQSVTTVALGVEATEQIEIDTVNTATWTAVATQDALLATASATANVALGTEDYEVTVEGTYTPPTGGGTTGGSMVYDINVLNIGTAILKNLQLSFVVPVGTAFAAGNDAWSCADGSPAGTVCTIVIGVLEPGADTDLVLNLNIIAEINIDQLALELSAETEGTPTSPTSSRGIVVVGPNAEQRVFIFLPILDRSGND